MRTLVIGDIHGAYLPLMQALDRARISPLDTLIFLGDYVDGWSQSPGSNRISHQLKVIIQLYFFEGQP